MGSEKTKIDEISFLSRPSKPLRVVRVYHAGRDAAHRARERALAAAGIELRLIVPTQWPGPDHGIAEASFDTVELDVVRPGDVNRHRYANEQALKEALSSWEPDVVDVHEEPVSLCSRQVLSLLDPGQPVTMYSAQNLDKRWPPPFARIERQSLGRVHAFYPCSRQAASVLFGKGYRGTIQVLDLGIDPGVFSPGDQTMPTDQIVLGLVGRLVPEKGLLDAVEVLAKLPSASRLVVVGEGPSRPDAERCARDLGLQDRIEWHPWVSAPELAGLYRRMHMVLVPSRATSRWVEQYGRVITESGACGAVAVGYSTGSIPEVTGAAGITVREDVTALTAAVQSLIKHPDTWTGLRERALERAQQITWSDVAAHQAALYAGLSPGPSPALAAADRHDAAARWGSPAATPLGLRPFAVPMLRDSLRAHRLMERLPSWR